MDLTASIEAFAQNTSSFLLRHMKQFYTLRYSADPVLLIFGKSMNVIWLDPPSSKRQESQRLYRLNSFEDWIASFRWKLHFPLSLIGLLAVYT